MSSAAEDRDEEDGREDISIHESVIEMLTVESCMVLHILMYKYKNAGGSLCNITHQWVEDG